MSTVRVSISEDISQTSSQQLLPRLHPADPPHERREEPELERRELDLGAVHEGAVLVHVHPDRPDGARAALGPARAPPARRSTARTRSTSSRTLKGFVT